MDKLILTQDKDNNLIVTVASSNMEAKGISIMDIALKDIEEGVPFWIVDRKSFEESISVFDLKIGLELDIESLGEPSGHGASYIDFPEEIRKKLKD
jgi:hypothetical protein